MAKVRQGLIEVFLISVWVRSDSIDVGVKSRLVFLSHLFKHLRVLHHECYSVKNVWTYHYAIRLMSNMTLETSW